MKQLRAFVGHSFDDQDQQLVRSFQDYFDSLKGTIDFEWDHAKRAEPRELCKKVKAKMEGKNLFIGIFTKKDFRIAPDKLEASEAPEKNVCLMMNNKKKGTYRSWRLMIHSLIWSAARDYIRNTYVIWYLKVFT